MSVFGLGYVGCVSAACLANDGHRVIGVDVNASKVAMLNRGAATIVEADIERLVADGVGSGRLSATIDTAAAVRETALSLVCVGTPSRPNGSLNTDFVRTVCRDIGNAIRTKSGPHTIVVRSTMLPGTTERVVIPELEAASGRRPGDGLEVLVNPEFLREGSAVKDYSNPPFTIVGTPSETAAGPLIALYRHIDAPVHCVGYGAAELLKYCCNAYHALKVAFANEVGALCAAEGIDSHRLMEIFCADAKLNISRAYLRPGFAFGGSCLPKDLRALRYHSRAVDVDLPLLAAVLASNESHLQRALRMVLERPRERVGVLGLTFKPGTDDLRESPAVLLVEQLIGRGRHVRFFDALVRESQIMGANRDFIEHELPHVWSLAAASASDVVATSDVIVVVDASPGHIEALRATRPEQLVIDLTGTLRQCRLPAAVSSLVG